MPPRRKAPKKAEVEAWQKEIKDLTSQVEALRQAGSAEGNEALQSALEEAENRVGDLEAEKVSLNAELKEMTVRQAGSAEGNEGLQNALEEAGNRVSDLEAQNVTLKAELEGITSTPAPDAIEQVATAPVATTPIASSGYSNLVTGPASPGGSQPPPEWCQPRERVVDIAWPIGAQMLWEKEPFLRREYPEPQAIHKAHFGHWLMRCEDPTIRGALEKEGLTL